MFYLQQKISSWQQILSSKYQYLAHKYKYKHQYPKIVHKYRSSTSISTQYNKTAPKVIDLSKNQTRVFDVLLVRHGPMLHRFRDIGFCAPDPIAIRT